MSDVPYFIDSDPVPRDMRERPRGIMPRARWIMEVATLDRKLE